MQFIAALLAKSLNILELSMKFNKKSVELVTATMCDCTLTL